jgi:undecaprenyl pyrophosphate synthase
MKYSQYSNFFLIISILTFFIFFCRYFLNKDEEYIKNLFSAKYHNSQLIDHVAFIPNFFYFFQNHLILNKSHIHVKYIKTIFELIEICFKKNIAEVTVELINTKEMLCLPQHTVDEFFENEFWNIITTNCEKFGFEIDILYNNELIAKEKQKILEIYKKKINKNKNKILKINFLIAYDTINEIQLIIKKLVNDYSIIEKENIDKICTRNNIQRIMYTNQSPYDIIFCFYNGYITQSKLIDTNGAKIIYLNDALHDINPNIIDLLITKNIYYEDIEY